MKSLRIVALLAFALVLIAVPACNKGNPGPQGGSMSGDGQSYGNYKLQRTYFDNAVRSKAKDNAADVLTQMPDEKNLCLVGLWAYNPPAILAAVRSAKKDKAVQIVGFDEDENTLLGIKEGSIHGTIVQQPYQFGYQSVKLMTELVKDPKTPLPKDGILHVPHLVIKKDNVDEFHEKLKKLKTPITPAKGEAAPGKIKVGFVSNNAEEFWTIAEAGTRQAAEDFGVEVFFRRPAVNTAVAQKEIIEDLLTNGVQAIAISVNDPENQQDYLNKIADRVPLITQDNDAPKSKRKCYIGTDNYEAGKAAGKLVKEAMPSGGTLAIFVGQPDALNAQQRRQGVLDELAGGAKDDKAAK